MHNKIKKMSSTGVGVNSLSNESSVRTCIMNEHFLSAALKFKSNTMTMWRVFAALEIF